MAEELDLATPIVEIKTIDTFYVVSIIMNSEAPGVSAPSIPPAPPTPPSVGMVMIMVKDNNGGMKNIQYTGTLAQDIIKFINTGDFTEKSLHKRILEKLNAEGVLEGEVSGTPDLPSSDTGLE